MNPEAPITLGLAGEAGSGKTSIANVLAPQGRVIEDEDLPIHWSHLYFAMPLYKMSTARQKIKGEDTYDRQCYELHDILTDLFRGYISYDELVDFVYEIVSTPVPEEGIKPRKFLQDIGMACRDFDKDCFVKWVERKIREDYQFFTTEQNRAEEMHDVLEPDEPFDRKLYGVVVSDTRFENECDLFRRVPNGILIKLTATPSVLRSRLEGRDGYGLKPSESSHISEQTLRTIPDEMFDAVIDTSELSLKDVYQSIVKVIRRSLA